MEPDANLDEVTVTYTVTAQNYGTTFVGEPFTVPVERVPMLDVLRQALKATEHASSSANFTVPKWFRSA